jgi:hypothetical protein
MLYTLFSFCGVSVGDRNALDDVKGIAIKKEFDYRIRRMPNFKEIGTYNVDDSVLNRPMKMGFLKKLMFWKHSAPVIVENGSMFVVVE